MLKDKVSLLLQNTITTGNDNYISSKKNYFINFMILLRQLSFPYSNLTIIALLNFKEIF